MLFEVRPTLNALGNTVLLNLHYLRGVEIEEPRAVDTAHFAVGRAEETTVTEPPPVSAGEAAAGAKPAPANDQAQDKHKDDDAHKKVTVHQKFAPMLANYVRLHLPVVDQASLEIDLHLRPAMWVLAGVLRKPGKDGSRERILLFVRCDIVEESPKQF